MGTSVETIDLNFLSRAGVIASFLVETTAGPVLVESGPTSTLEALENALCERGYTLGNIGHVFLSHIHLDHAGAAWRLAEMGAMIHVHPAGVKHLVAPDILWASAKRIYGEAMERLWGEMRAISNEQVHPCEDGERVEVGDAVFTAHETLGHAKHHLAWQLNDEALFTGDVAGVKLGNGPVQPPCPPPDIDLETWENSFDLIRRLAPSCLYLTHFGRVEEAAIERHLKELHSTLREWADWIHGKVDSGLSSEALVPKFERFVSDRLTAAGLGEDACLDYETANPAFMSVSGLTRYWKKRAQA